MAITRMNDMKISIIIPTYNEGLNVLSIADRIRNVAKHLYDYELIFVDDSRDDTPAVLESLSEADPNVQVLHREGERGLATAVLEGFRMSTGDLLIVMDADLQHPPEVIPEMIRKISEGYDIVIPSRFVPGGSDGGLNIFRKAVSWTARSIARTALKRLRPITDPTSGFFAIRKEVQENVILNPIGWKILMELLVKGEYKTVTEIPFAFEARSLGDSKMSFQEQMNFVRHTIRLMKASEEDVRFWKFCLVGLSGVAVNSLTYTFLVRIGVFVPVAFGLATLLAMVCNFIWNDMFTWRFRKGDRLVWRFGKYVAVSCAGLAASGATVAFVHGALGVHYMAAGFGGIALSVFWNYMMNNKWTFQKPEQKPSHAGKIG